MSTPSPSPATANRVRDLAAQHRDVTNQLADSLAELSATRSAIVTHRRDAWAQHAHLNVTERREATSHAVAALTAETELLLGDVEGARALLAGIEFEFAALKFLEGGDG